MAPASAVFSTLSQNASRPPASPAASGADAAASGRAENEISPPQFDPIACLGYLPNVIRNSWFLIGHLETTEGRKFNCLLHQIVNSAPGEPITMASIVNITDITAGTYRGEERLHTEPDVRVSRAGMDNLTPTSAMSGDHRSIRATADFGWGALSLRAEFPGHVMMNGGSAVFSFLGGTSTVQYSVPWGRGSGILTLDGVRHEVSGDFWFDRQWGLLQGLLGEPPTPVDPTDNWLWMDLNLSNGIALGLWDLEVSGQRHSWVTALYPDGTHVIAAIEPQPGDPGSVWTSPSTGQHYPTRFKVKVPALNCVLDVTALIEAQEIVSPTEPKYEGVASISGSFAGEAVTGFTLIEMVGNWRR